MVKCKKCESKKTVKNGKITGVQRYKCKECGYNFRKGDKRTNRKIKAKKALCILMYTKGRNSFRMIGDILKIDHTIVYRWIKAYAESIEEPKVSEATEEIEFDERLSFAQYRHYIGSKKTNSGS